MNRNARVWGALLLVLLSLMAASLACYSGQIPGVFELTPYYTETPLPIPEVSRFKLGDIALAPPESNRAFFNLTVFPEPLASNLVNSKEMCEPDSTVRVLYVGVASDQQNYYLVDCVGSVGWVEENRLAGPLKFEPGQLALTLAAQGTQKVNMLDPVTLQPMFLQTCKPGSVTDVLSVQAKDGNKDGVLDVYYQIDCPTGNRGYVTDADLFGPLEINVGDRALALSAPDAPAGTPYRMSQEPGPLTDANAVEGECKEGSVLEAKEVQLVDNVVYYRMACGDVEGWADQDRFVGPLLFDADSNAMIYMPPVATFKDQLTPEQAAELGITIETPEAGEGETGGDAAAGDTGTADTGTADSGAQQEVIYYTPPLILTDKPGPAPEGQAATVVGQCSSRSLAHIEEYTGIDQVYYRITCDQCTETEVNEDGETVCKTTETRDGWVEQRYLQGPVLFVPGQLAMVQEKSKSLMDVDGAKWARIPSTREGAAALGPNTNFAGRCPQENGVEVTDVWLEKDRTRNAFSFYYQVRCTGETTSYTQVTDPNGKVRSEVAYNEGTSEVITGWLLGRELAPVEQP